MKNLFRCISVFLCLAMLLTSGIISTSAISSDPDSGIFIFDSEDMLSYVTLSHSLDISFSDTENTMKLEVNSPAADPDPYFCIDFSKLKTLKADDLGYLLIVYRSPSTNSAKANKAELFPCAGSISAPTGGYSKTFDLTYGNNYAAQTIKLSELSWWKGNISVMRLDPFCKAIKGDTMYIDTIALCKNARDADRYMKSRLDTKVTAENIYKGTDYICTAYDVTKYTAPLWKGGIVYNEAIYPIMDENGNATYTLMYTPDKVMCLYSSNFNSYYIEGVDYKVEGNKLTVLKTGSIPLVSYSYIHRKQNDGGYFRKAAGDRMYEYWGQSKEFFDGYLNITYTHSDKWQGYVPENKSEKLPLTSKRISNKESINIVYFGDSICGGANSSSYRNVYPYAEWWNEQISSKLQKDLGCKVTAEYESVGGSTASDMVSSVYDSVIRYSPDLVFIEYGANDAMNASQSDDYSASRLKGEFKSGIEEMIKTIRRSLPDCEIVLVAPFYCNIYCHYESYFEACRDALAELEDAYSGVVFADVTKMHKYLLGFKDYLDMSGDNMCHPNDFMARIFAQVCLETILPGGTEAYIPKGEMPNPGDTPQIRPTGEYTYAAPDAHGWYWSDAHAYGYLGNYGTNGQNIILTFDLCLLKSTEESVAKFWTKDGNHIFISPDSVSIGTDLTEEYDWGKPDISNWHTVSIAIKNGAASVFIDGEKIISVSSGIQAYTDYQLLFCNTGSMYIDNVSMRTDNGKVYFDCDFEDSAAAEKLMGAGLGECTYISANTVKYDLTGGSGTIQNQIKVDNIPMPITSTVPRREGYTFAGWSDSASATTVKYRADDLYTEDVSTTLYAVWQLNAKAPEIESITPKSAALSGAGSVTYTMIANGGTLTYDWQCTSGSKDKVTVSGADSQSLVVSVTSPVKESFEVKFACTVTNEYGLSVTSGEVVFVYSGIEDEITLGDITGDGKVNAKDSNLLKRIVLGKYKPNIREETAADINKDGKVNTKDVYLLKHIIIGK